MKQEVIKTEITGCSVHQVNIKTIGIPAKYDFRSKIFQDYNNSEEREEDIEQYAQETGLPEVHLDTEGQVAHAQVCDIQQCKLYTCHKP